MTDRRIRFSPNAAVRRWFDLGVHQVAKVGYGLSPAARPQRYDVDLVRDVQYLPTGRRAHRLDVYRPRAQEPRPVVMYVHGGAFSMLSKDTNRIFALALASQGYVVFNVNYRLAPRHRYPAALEDVCAALLYTAAHAGAHGGDPRRLAVMGESAGGNLTAAVTYAAFHPRPEPFARAVFDAAVPIRAALPIYGIHDVVDVPRMWRDPYKRRRMMPWVKNEIWWAAYSYVGRRADEAPLASPVRLYEAAPPPGSRKLPPFFVTCGTADPLLDDSRRLRAAIEARGTACELHVYPGEIHGFNAMLWRRAAREKWGQVFRFLGRHLDAAR